MNPNDQCLICGGQVHNSLKRVHDACLNPKVFTSEDLEYLSSFEEEEDEDSERDS